MSVRFITLNQRQRDNSCSGNTLLACSKESHGRFICRENDHLIFLGNSINVYWLSSKGLRHRYYEAEPVTKRPGKPTKGVLFHQGDASEHKSLVSMAAVRDFELWTGWSSSVLCWFDCFYNMKKHQKTISQWWWRHICCCWGFKHHDEQSS